MEYLGMLNQILDWLGQFIPVTSGRMEREIRDAIANTEEVGRRRENQLRKQHEKEIQETACIAHQIIARCSDLRFGRIPEHEQYMLSISFSPALVMYGACTQEEQNFIAHSVAGQVEREIASSRFVRKAQEYEIERQLAAQGRTPRRGG